MSLAPREPQRSEPMNSRRTATLSARRSAIGSSSSAGHNVGIPRYLQRQSDGTAMGDARELSGANVGVEGQLPRYLQAKLAVSNQGDALEQQANQVAERVMRTTDTPVQRQRVDNPERMRGFERQPMGLRADLQCAAANHGEAEADRAGQEALGRQRASAPHARRDPVTVTAETEAEALSGQEAGVLSSGGQPLQAGVREDMERRFGHNFEAVRVHADNEAASRARRSGAKAYAFGTQLVFAPGRYAPGTEEGRALLAHELAHVLQQTRPGARQRVAAKLEPTPGSTPVPLPDAPERFTPGETRMAAAIKIMTRLRDDYLAEHADAVDTQTKVKKVIAFIEGLLNTENIRDKLVTYHDARDEEKLCRDALGAVKFMETGFRVAIPDLRQASAWNSAIGAMKLAERPLAVLAGPTTQQRYEGFIEDADFYGLPTKMLRDVDKNTKVVRANATDDDRYVPKFQTLFLRDSSLGSGKSRGLDAKQGAMGATIGTVYHESAHAFLDQHKDSEPYKSAIAAAMSHYKDAPVGTDGEPASDTYRLVQEACGEYVDQRMTIWWDAYSQLVTYANVGKLNDKLVEGIRQTYEEKRKQLEFGYVESLLGKQQHTSRSISKALRQLLNDDLLEGKIDLPFDDVPQFKTLLAAARQHKQIE